MKERFRGAAVVVITLAVTAPLLPAEESFERYAVVYQKDYKNQESYTIMAESEYRAASRAALNEGANLRKALSAARGEWHEKENKRVGKKSMADYLNQNNTKQNSITKKQNSTTFERTERTVPFPSLDVNMSPIFRCLTMCGSQEDAEVKRKAFEAQAAGQRQPLGGGLRAGGNLAPSGLKRPSSGSKDARGGELSDSDAMALFEKHLEEVRRGTTRASSGSGSGAVKRLGGPIESIVK